MTGMLWSAVAVAGAVSLLAPFGLRPLLYRFGVFDVPNHRSSHSEVTLRGGGVAPLLGILAGGIWAVTVLDGEARLFTGVIVAAGVVMSLVGLVEDVRGLRVIFRAGLQLVVGAGVAITLSMTTGIHWLWVPIAALFFAANVNFTNFMDGVNGISGLHGLVAGIGYAALGLMEGDAWLQVVGLIVAAVFIAFLPWNLTPPRMFLGDVGSYLLGGLLGATAMAALITGLNPLAAVAPLSVYWTDTVTTLVKRIVRRERVYEAHRTHAYQRLADTQMRHVAVAVTVACFTAAVSMVGLMQTATMIAEPAVAWIFALALLAAYLSLPSIRARTMRGSG